MREWSAVSRWERSRQARAWEVGQAGDAWGERGRGGYARLAKADERGVLKVVEGGTPPPRKAVAAVLAVRTSRSGPLKCGAVVVEP